VSRGAAGLCQKHDRGRQFVGVSRRPAGTRGQLAVDVASGTDRSSPTGRSPGQGVDTNPLARHWHANPSGPLPGLAGRIGRLGAALVRGATLATLMSLAVLTARRAPERVESHLRSSGLSMDRGACRRC